MSFLSNLIPTNLNEEKAKFFADQTYNPQFIYSEPIDQEKLVSPGMPKQKYLQLAQNTLKKAYFNTTETELFLIEGPTISQKEVEEKIKTFLQMHQLEKRFKVSWSSSYVSRATITSDLIKLRLPVDFRKEGLLGMLYHEIGTHALRRLNYEQQPWYKKKKRYGFGDYLKTEEGLATLHAMLPHTNKSAFVSAIRYVAVEKAQTSSFAETWDYLKQYIDDLERRWMVTLRQKRGLEDTSKPGGYTKDLVYFEGMVQTYKWLEKNNFDITRLYYGKIAAEDVSKAVAIDPHFKPALPSFFTTNPEKYAQEIKKIGEANEL